MKKQLLFVILLILALPIFGQEEKIENKFEEVHHVGLHAGVTSGIGFSYRYWPKELGFQVTGIPFFENDNSFYSFGLSFLAKLRDDKVVDLYGYVSNHLMLRTGLNYNYDQMTGEYTTSKYTRETFNIGVGMGLEFSLWKVVKLNLQTGYGLVDITNSITGTIIGECGLYYSF
ncbi:hypothetical protein [Crocinitomix algicola]|uniref:hypothetical protein n=1 Tax=Crocinitomix algicola TaxID=1740263 RepID=UPI00087250A5|nr:hypothetical protein [Crocinitomix algicola]